ncbi:MAG: class E sortase [Actinomycetota bacterium]|nr:class E sortase [Actinomycetota bacterium]
MIAIRKQKRDRRGAGRAFESGRASREMRVFRRRKRGRGFFAFFALTTLALAALGATSLSGDLPAGVGGDPVVRVDAPATADAPEPVADLEAQAERKAAEKEAAEREAAEKEEAQRAAAPPAPEDPTTYLTVPRLGIYGHTVRNDDSERALGLGAIKVPETGFPWQEGATNTYIAGHRVGWPGTESHYQFYDLPAMRKGDKVFLEDANGTVYTYRVTEIFAVSPWESWVTKPIPGRDVVSLQTCTESLSDWWTLGRDLFSGGPESGRLVVRADRVD